MTHLVKLTLAGVALALSFMAVAAGPADSKQAQKLMQDGNYKDALAQFRKLTLETDKLEPGELIEDFRGALNCYQQLNDVDSIDAYREAVVEKHAAKWRVVADVAQSYIEVQHQGFMVSGEFNRGNKRGGGQVMHATARDRVRALQLFRQAMELVEKDDAATKTEHVRPFISNYANALMFGGTQAAWKLQLLTDSAELPDYEEGWGYYGGETRGAPVDAEGNPVFYEVPASWKEAKNDGERWRWLLAALTKWQPDRIRDEWRTRAEFLQSQFGVQTMAEYSWWFARQASDADTVKSTFDLHTLGDDETMARLATGIKRFKLPDEHNYISLQKKIAEGESKGSAEWQEALSTVAEEYENRQQYPRAAELWKELATALPGTDFGARLKQVVDSWGRFEPTVAQQAGRGATIDYRFRNGKRVEFTARPVKVRQLLADVKTYLKSDPKQLNWQQLQIEQLGYRLIVEGQEKYLDAESARWSLDLDPRPDHFDRRVTVTTPLQQAGAYLVTAKIEGGNEHRIVVWIADTAIVKKPLPDKALYYVADATTGKPLPKMNVEFFGYWQEHVGNGRFVVHTKDGAEFTDANGMVQLSDAGERRHQWLAIATEAAGGDAKVGSGGRFAFLGYSGIWSGQHYEQQYEQVKVFAITDRPVYRPGHEVNFKFWVANAKFDQPDASPFAAQSFLVEIANPRGEKVFSQSLVADSYGGLAGSWKLPDDATLGQYQFTVVNHGGGSFRVEEYKKPEYEVTIDAPKEPVQLGDKITAKISAKYYFGAPVTEARVKYKVLRTSYTNDWFPPGPWDWLYGPGYGWLAEDYAWYPGWARWGCLRPLPWYFWRAPMPPEVVAESEAQIAQDGTLEVVIDTATAKELHPDQDHSYTIQAEVVDQSRRTIMATGSVLAAREPFRVYVWADRGYYRADQTIGLDMAARTIDGKPVEGDGVVRLLKIVYENEKPVENEVARWTVPTDAEGRATLQIKAGEPGQYRLAYEVTAKSGARPTGGEGAGEATAKTIEGGMLLTIRGEGFDGSGYEFNDVEVVPEKPEYAPGDKVRLQISANRAGAAVLLFLRPANGIYLPPQMVRLQGKSAVVELDATQKDMPNFFVEAVTVHGGKLHTAVREIYVPPTKRVFNVDVEPSAKEYLPGAKAKVKIKLTDLEGKPVTGSTVVAIYDKALDYIAGNASLGDIREFFWKWRRTHNSTSETNLTRMEGPAVKSGEVEMQNLGVFGDSTADEDQSGVGKMRGMRGGFAGRGGGAFGGGGGFGAARGAMLEGEALAMDATAAPAAPMAAAAPPGGPMEKGAAAGEAAGADVQPTIRQEFADTALWAGSLETDAEGVAEVQLDMPENLSGIL